MTDTNALVREIQDFMQREFTPENPEPLTEDLDLIEAQILDSLAMIRMLDYLEEKCGCEIGSHELTPPNIGSIRKLAEFVQKKKTRAS